MAIEWFPADDIIMVCQIVLYIEIIINNTRGGIVILTSGKKRNTAIGGRIQVPDVYSFSHRAPKFVPHFSHKPKF